MYIIRIGKEDYLNEFSIRKFYTTKLKNNAKMYSSLVGARKSLDILVKRTYRDLNIEIYKGTFYTRKSFYMDHSDEAHKIMINSIHLLAIEENLNL